MNYYYISGTSRGIGFYLAGLLLQRDDTFVFGLSRTNAISHERYQHFSIDLCNLNQVRAFCFKEHSEASSITLVNNAGALGDLKRVGDLEDASIVNSYNVNIVSPSLLMNKFLKKYQYHNATCTILNISSGAGRSPMNSWSGYCASKAALDMFSRVASNEQKKNFSKNGVRIYSIAPGVVDTQMQDEIRASKLSDFNELERFIDYKNSGKLYEPCVVAKKLIDLCESTDEDLSSLLDIDLLVKREEIGK